MNDLEQFRAALQAPDPNLRPLDIPSIMKVGTRVRRRRRFVVGAGSGLAVLALLVGGNQLVQLTRPPTSPGIAVGAPGPATASPGTPTPQPPAAAPPATASPQQPTETPPPSETPPSETLLPDAQTSRPPRDDVLGDIVSTGLKAGTGEWVISMITVDMASLPDVTVGIKASRRLKTGALVGGYVSNETEGSDRSDGFHATSGSQNIDGADMPAFGYYVGPATTITGRAGGRTVQARQQAWSEDANVKIFWFDLANVDPDTEVTGLAAYGKTGRKLPTGNATIAVG